MRHGVKGIIRVQARRHIRANDLPKFKGLEASHLSEQVSQGVLKNQMKPHPMDGYCYLCGGYD